MGRVICTLSGGKASAWCAGWAIRTFPKDDVILYFNDTKWEDPDLYRFLKDLSIALDHPITEDSKGISVEELWYKEFAISSQRFPFCSEILKAKRLQRFYKDGDILIFGIGNDEAHRAERITARYQKIAVEAGKYPKLLFPLISEKITQFDIDSWLLSINVKPPRLYAFGFTHNNCGGGCVRAGKVQWKRLYDTLPEVYLERERAEKDFQQKTGKNVTILKGESLEHLRGRIVSGKLSRRYNYQDKDKRNKECIGICSSEE